MLGFVTPVYAGSITKVLRSLWTKSKMAASVSTLVTAEWLYAQIMSGKVDEVRILDVSLGHEDQYKKSHLPGAVFFDITYKAEHTEYLRRNLPSPEHFEELCRSFGISSSTHVIIYEATGTNGFYFGGRGWWMFRYFGHDKVSILNGGMEKWVEKGLVTSKVVPLFKPGNFTSTINTSLMVNYDAMVSNLTSKKFTVVDARPASQFAGSADDEKSGHIPGSVSIPHSDLLDKETGLLKTTDQIKQMLADKKVDLASGAVIGSCNTATSAATTGVIAKMLGYPDVPMYLGSFQEWKRRADNKDIERS